MGNVIQTITWFVTIQFSMMIHARVLGSVHFSIKRLLGTVLFSTVLACGVFLLKTPMPYARYILMTVFITVFAYKTSDVTIDLAFIATLISLGISFGFFMLNMITSILLIRLVFGSSHDLLSSCLTLIMQSISFMLLFRIKRFRNGITFLQKKGAGATGLIICGIIMLLFALINRGGVTAKSGGWLISGIALCIAGVIFWWRRGLTKHYREKVRERNSQEYEKIIEERDKQIQRLMDDNDRMASLIHRDNKLLPALYDAVMLFMTTEANAPVDGRQIISQIEQLMKERAGIIKQSISSNSRMPLTNDIVTDGILNYMKAKASEKGIQLDAAVMSSLSDLTGTIESATNLHTLCMDLIENAINAVSKSEIRRVLITFSAVEGIYELSVQDSGIPFMLETFHKLGLVKASTRLDEGGSGYGYMTLCRILHGFKASLIIKEFDPAYHEFTKSITVRFDGKDAFTIISHRSAEIRATFTANHLNENSPEIRSI